MNEEAVIEKFTAALKEKFGNSVWDLRNATEKVSYSEKLSLGRYVLTLDGVGIATFELHPMINCCGICVSTQASVIKQWQGKGLGTLLNSMRIDIARVNGYGVLLCTDIESNTYQRKILARNGWKDVHSFVNPRTRNRVFISVINL